MANNAQRIRGLVNDALAQGEMRHLSLVVAVRKGLAPEGYKGDLARSVNVALQELVRAQLAVETDGMYSLTKPVAPVAADAN